MPDKHVMDALDSALPLRKLCPFASAILMLCRAAKIC